MEQTGQSFIPSGKCLVIGTGNGNYQETRIMYGRVYESELNQEAAIDDMTQPNVKTEEDLSEQEDDGYYTPESDPQE